MIESELSKNIKSNYFAANQRPDRTVQKIIIDTETVFRDAERLAFPLFVPKTGYTLNVRST